MEIKKRNIYLIPPGTIKTCQCNYKDNYYGDQACIETKKKSGEQK